MKQCNKHGCVEITTVLQDLCNAHGDVNDQNCPLDVNSSIRSKPFTIVKPHRIILGKHGE